MKVFFKSGNVMLNEAKKYIAGVSVIDLLPPTGQLSGLLKRRTLKSHVGEVCWWKKLGILWTCLPTWLTLMSQTTDTAFWILYKFSVVLQGAIPPHSCPCVGTDTSESRCWCWKLIVLAWINACGCLKATVSAGEVVRMGSWGWCQKEPSFTVVTPIYARLQDLSLHAHKRPLLSWFSGA